MRKFCIVTKDFSGLGFGLLNKEDEVIFACNPDMEKFKDKSEDFNRYKNVGKGMADVFLLSEIMENRKDMKDWYFIWDGNHSVEENETLRKEGFKVGLGGELSYKMENDREFGIELAEKHGIESPLWEEFQDNKKGIEFLKQYSNDAFFLKPNAVEESHKTTAPVGRDPKKANEI